MPDTGLRGCGAPPQNCAVNDAPASSRGSDPDRTDQETTRPPADVSGAVVDADEGDAHAGDGVTRAARLLLTAAPFVVLAGLFLLLRGCPQAVP